MIAALEYLLHNPLEPLNEAQFAASCGVGITVTPEEIEAAVSNKIFCLYFKVVIITLV